VKARDGPAEASRRIREGIRSKTREPSSWRAYKAEGASMSPRKQSSACFPDLSDNGEAEGTATSLVDPNWACGLAGGGEMSDRIRSFDWSSTPLGPISEWSLSLRQTLSTCLRSRFQLAIYWGPRLVLLYNDAERDILGSMHPHALGRPADEILADSWDVLGPMLQGALYRGEASWSVDQALRFNRRGIVEESFFTYSYSPIPDGDGIGGVLLVTFETTEYVLAQRRLRTLAETANGQNVAETCSRAAGMFAGNRNDRRESELWAETREAQERAASILEKITDGFIALDRQWRFTYVNAEAERICGIRREDQIGKNQWELFPTTRATVFEHELRRAMAEQVPVQFENYYEPADAWFHVKAYPSKDGGVSVFFNDITAHKRSEEALQKAHDELERRVQARTRELSQVTEKLERQIIKRKRVEEARTALLRRLVRAQEEERRRIARELHDDLTQRLAVLAIDAGKLEKLLDGHGDLRDRVRDFREQLVSLSEGVHSLSHQLHPSILDDLGLADALRAECNSLAQRDNILVRFHADNVPSDLSREVALSVYRVTQEALRNVARHAQTQEVSVRLVAKDGELVLGVRDWGIGFDVAARGKTGLGLESMRERVRLIRAHLTVRSQLGKGTKITVRIPLDRSQS
jgi:PAS domain S-box-containing protein